MIAFSGHGTDRAALDEPQPQMLLIIGGVSWLSHGADNASGGAQAAPAAFGVPDSTPGTLSTRQKFSFEKSNDRPIIKQQIDLSVE